jgi:hypothetical protein
LQKEKNTKHTIQLTDIVFIKYFENGERRTGTATVEFEPLTLQEHAQLSF